MARNKNSTRKKNRKRNRKTYRKIANRNMRGGGMSSLLSSLTTNLTNSFSIFGSNAKEQATNTINAKKEEAQAKITQARGYVNKKTECLAACAKL